MKSISEIKSYIERQKGKRQQLEQQFDEISERIKTTNRDLRQYERAREITQQIALKMQEQLQYNISNITSMALGAIFDNPYSLEVEFVQRRNKTECDLYFARDGQRHDPMTASGGGTVDVASFALRIASWAMENPRKNNTIILDEPLRFLSEDNEEEASLMIDELSQKLNLQFIIITHKKNLTTYADRLFETRLRKKRTIVRIVE